MSEACVVICALKLDDWDELTTLALMVTASPSTQSTCAFETKVR
jgi:hypothetical protein